MKINPKQWTAGLAVIVTTMLATTPTLALPGAPDTARRGAGVLRAALARVGLTAEQRERIRSIMAVERPSLEALRGRQLSSKAELDSALEPGSPDPTAVGKAFLRVRADRQALHAEMRKVREQTLSVLTPEQRATVVGYLEGVRAMHRRGKA